MKGLFLAISAIGIITAAVLGPTRAWGQADEDYLLTLSDEVGAVGGVSTVTVGFSNVGEPIQGMQFGICSDDAQVTIASGDVVAGSSLDGVSFTFQSIFVQESGGWTVGALYDVVIGETLAPGEYDDVYQATYSLDSVGVAPLEFCGTLGSPMVAVAVVVDGGDVEPAVEHGSITVEEGDLPYCFELEPNRTVAYDPSVGVGSFTVGVSISESEDNPGFPHVTTGFQMGISHDGAVLQLVDESQAAALLNLNDGAGPGFYGATIDPDDEAGFTVGVVYSLTGASTLVFDEPTRVLNLTYELVSEQFVNDELGGASTIEFDDGLGSPVVVNAVVVNGETEAVCQRETTVSFVPAIAVPFVRGDCNDDGMLNIADGVRLLAALFQPGADPVGCLNACDTNGDNLLDQSDAVFVFNYRFLEGPPPAAPFPGCGVGAGAVDCVMQQSCM